MTHLKMANQYLVELVKQSKDIFWIKNTDYSKQLYISPAYEKIWGLPCQLLYEFPGGWINSIFLEDREQLERDLAKRNPEVIPTEKFYQAYRIIRPDGQVCWIEDESFAIFDSRGKHIGFAGIAKDVTEKMMRELSLKKATKEANAANKAKTEFIANMSHDLRTPLNGIIGLAEILRKVTKSKENKEYGEMIYEASQELLELLNSVLETIKADHVKENNFYIETFDLHDVLKNLYSLMRTHANVRHIGLNFEIDSNLPRYVASDQLKIQRILQNLLGNAIKFTHQGSVSLNVKLLKKAHDNVEIKFSITDTGIGISKEQQLHIFERFFRVKPSYEGVYDGHGIGLYIVKKFVTALGGTIQVDSKIGEGTCISFLLSMKIDKAKDPKKIKYLSKESQKNISEKSEINLQNIRENIISEATLSVEKKLSILFVEDNDIARITGKTILENEGHQVLTAETAEIGINLFKRQSFDLVISDLGLPGIQGHEMVSLLRYWEKISRKQPTPIVALTAHANNEIKNYCLLAGIGYIFNKPLDEQLLIDIINFTRSNKKTSELQKEGNTEQAEGLGHDLPLNEEELFALEKYPILNDNDGLEKSGNKEELRTSLIMLLEMIPAEIVNLEEAHLAGDWDKAQKIAHKLRGGSLYCGTNRMTIACQYFEIYWKTDQQKLLEELYQQAIKVIELTKKNISLYLNSPLQTSTSFKIPLANK